MLWRWQFSKQDPFKHDKHDFPKIEFEVIHPDTFDQGSCAALFLHGLPAFILSKASPKIFTFGM